LGDLSEFPLKYNDPQKQHAVLAAALSLLENQGLKPLAIVDFR